MYNNSYSQSKFGASAKKIHKARGKSCGYYMKIVFFFSSLIQTLIIVSLVLFLVYGQPEESAAEKRLQVLDPMHNELITKYGYLQEETRNLTRKINMTNREMEYMQRNITMLRKLGNDSVSFINSLRNKLLQCQMSSSPPCNCPRVVQPPCQSNGQLHGLQYENSQLKKWLEIVQGNFSGTFHVLKDELDSANRDRESLRLETITLRQEKATAEREIEHFKTKCKEDFIKSLDGIPEITKAFRAKIGALFPQLIPFHITCPKQREQLEQIQYNCSSLSAEVENKFQPYLNNVGLKVSETLHRVSHLEAKKIYLDRNLFECKQNLSSLAETNYKNLRDTRERHDKAMEQVLLEQRKLRGAKELLDGTLSLKESEINMLKEKINASLANCGHRAPPPKPFPGNSAPGGGGMGTGGILPGSGSTFSVQPGSGIKPTARGSGGPDSSLFKKFELEKFGRSGVNQVGSGGTGMGNTGSSGPSSDRFPTAAGSSTPGSGKPALGGTGPGTGSGSSGNMGTFGTGSSHSVPSGTGAGRTGSGTGLGSPTGGGMNTGSFGTGNDRSGSSGTGFGSSSSMGSTGAGFNTGSFGTGAGAGHSGTGFGSTSNMGAGGAGFGNTGSAGAGGSRSALPGAGTGTTGQGNTGFGGAGSSRTGQSGTGSGGTGFGGFGSAGTGRTGFSPNGFGRTGTGGNTGLYGGGSYGTADPISNHLRELQKYLNPERY
ncbi:keratin, type I cytoskeletal 9-like [Alosa sapidissima]|uniref:keratin, type I cytoskeletal 9-like n=1 Tax=Alosa sapidissima TaxID=34773 RepID=UPI001C0A3183|nr:keratin, type I cytoskeletal 9-like [Alosa sapidissima]